MVLCTKMLHKKQEVKCVVKSEQIISSAAPEMCCRWGVTVLTAEKSHSHIYHLRHNCFPSKAMFQSLMLHICDGFYTKAAFGSEAEWRWVASACVCVIIKVQVRFGNAVLHAGATCRGVSSCEGSSKELLAPLGATWKRFRINGGGGTLAVKIVLWSERAAACTCNSVWHPICGGHAEYKRPL